MVAFHEREHGRPRAMVRVSTYLPPALRLVGSEPPSSVEWRLSWKQNKRTGSKNWRRLALASLLSLPGHKGKETDRAEGWTPRIRHPRKLASIPSQLPCRRRGRQRRSAARSPKELTPRGIRVNTISPGPIVTPILEKGGLTPAQKDNFIEGAKTRIPLGRTGTAAEVAAAALYLAADATYTTGAELFVDGGLIDL